MFVVYYLSNPVGYLTYNGPVEGAPVVKSDESTLLLDTLPDDLKFDPEKYSVVDNILVKRPPGEFDAEVVRVTNFKDAAKQVMLYMLNPGMSARTFILQGSDAATAAKVDAWFVSLRWGLRNLMEGNHPDWLRYAALQAFLQGPTELELSSDQYTLLVGFASLLKDAPAAPSDGKLFIDAHGQRTALAAAVSYGPIGSGVSYDIAGWAIGADTT